MDEGRAEIIHGTLVMVILKILSLKPLHGFGIAQHIARTSRGVFKVNPGSLLPALERLEQAGCIESVWRQTDNSRRAKFYTLTRSGRVRLETDTTDWEHRVSAVRRLLKTKR